MEQAASGTMAAERIPAGRLLRVGVLAAALSAGVNALVLAISSSLFGRVVILTDEAITIGQVVGASAAGAIGAAVVFAVVVRFARRSIFVFSGIAVLGLLVSFIPIALAGATGSSAGTLALMHAVAAATDVGLLTRLGPKE